MTCDCMDKLDDHLKAHNSRLVRSFMLGGGMCDRPTIQVEKINPRNRDCMGAIASFCPFCGVPYNETARELGAAQ